MQGGEKTIEGFCPAGYEGRSERKRGREGCRVPAGALFHFLFGFEAKLPLERCLRRKEIANEKGADSTTVPLAILVAWTANADPISYPSPSRSNLVEQVGCKGGPSPEDRCPYGYRLERGDGGRGYCAPCGRYGSRYRDWNDRYNERRQYRDYGDYGSRRYREYDDRSYEPRRYPREYY
jgi:hypothetical protein